MTVSEVIRVPRAAALNFAAQCQAKTATLADAPAWNVAGRVLAICAAGARQSTGAASLPSGASLALAAESGCLDQAAHNLRAGVTRQAGALAALAAHTIDRAFRYATLRQIAGKRLCDHQLTAPKLATLTIVEQILCAQLDALSEASIGDAASEKLQIAASEILRGARDVADLIVDHFGGTGFVGDDEVPLCRSLEEQSRALAIVLHRFAQASGAGEGPKQ